MHKALFLLGALLLRFTSFGQSEKHAAVLLLPSPITIVWHLHEQSFQFLANLSDTLRPSYTNNDTLSYFTRFGVLKVYWKEQSPLINYHFAGQWKKSEVHPVFASNEKALEEGFYKDRQGNVCWLKWSGRRQMPLLYSPYRKYRSYLLKVGNNAHLNSEGDEINIHDDELLYQPAFSSKAMGLKRFSAYQKKEVFVPAHGDSLFGYIFTPQGEGPHPACLLLQGGGSVGIGNYLLEAEFLAAHGFVTAVFNKSGEEQSKGSTDFRLQSFNQKLEEYEILFQWLARQKDVDQEQMGLHGMSEGGRLVIDLAARLGSQVRFVNAVSGPLSSFADNQLYAIYGHLHNQLWPDSVIAVTTSLWARYFYEAEKGEISQETQQQLTTLRATYPGLYLPSRGGQIPADLRKEDIAFHSFSSLEKVFCPILFQLAARDTRVDVARTASFARELHTNPRDWIRFYPETVHGMTDQFGNITSGYLYDKVEWFRTLKILKP